MSAASLTLLSGCVSPGPTQSTAPESQTMTTQAKTQDQALAPSVLDEIYVDIDGTIAAYHEAIELLESGSVKTGEAMLSDALLGLDDLVSRCRAIQGCDLSHAVQAYQEIISLQTRVFEDEIAEEYGDSAIESPAEDPDPASLDLLTAPAASLFSGTNLEHLIDNNRYVKEALNDWLTWNRPLLMRAHENYQFLRAEMAPAYIEAGFPEALLFGMLVVESAGKVHAYSRAGAAGPLQFMRATGKRYGLTTRDGFDLRMDPALSARANVAYLQEQLRQLQNSLEKALAAYNSGENRVKRLNRKLRGMDFWNSEFYYALPRDTRGYVPKVLAAAWLFLHPERYRLEFVDFQAQHAELILENDMSLGELAICFGNAELRDGWFRTLRNLNPAVKPGDRVKAGESLQVPDKLIPLYQQNCTDQELLETAANLHDAGYNEREDLLPYVVQNGDTLSRIARRHHCMSIKEIAAINNIKPPRYLIRAGKMIKVPNC
jgi:membrane-bound lytic murein transglycosylase D